MTELLTQHTLAEHLGVPEGTLTDWRYRRIGPAYIRVGKHVRYSREAVEAWLNAQTVKTA